MDLYEDPKTNFVLATLELPGVKKEDVNIEVNNGRLAVSAESKMESDREEGGHAIRERRYGRFSRTLQLPEGVKVGNPCAALLQVRGMSNIYIGVGHQGQDGTRDPRGPVSQVWPRTAAQEDYRCLKFEGLTKL